jgi:alanine racemase
VTRLIRARIDSAALRANLQAVRARAPRSRVMAVVKANAYGHGLVPAALALADADAFAVARLEEAVALREAGLKRRIVLLEGVLDAAQMAQAAALNLIWSCISSSRSSCWSSFAARGRFRCGSRWTPA